MTILVEGIDNAGKTTLCKWLGDVFKLPIIQPLGKSSPDKLLERVYSTLHSTKLEIYDRCTVFSEAVYGSVLRGHSAFGSKNWEFIYLLMWRDPLLIYCRPPENQIFRFGDREQMDGVKEKRVELLKFYDRLMDLTHIMMPNPDNFYLYDWTQNQKEDLYDKVRWYLMQRQMSLQKLETVKEMYPELIGEAP